MVSGGPRRLQHSEIPVWVRSVEERLWWGRVDRLERDMEGARYWTDAAETRERDALWLACWGERTGPVVPGFPHHRAVISVPDETPEIRNARPVTPTPPADGCAAAGGGAGGACLPRCPGVHG